MSGTIDLAFTLPAPPEVVFPHIADHARYSEWLAPMAKISVAPGRTDPNGAGAVRRIEVFGVRIDEEVVDFEPPRRLTYKLTRGLGIREHHGEVRLDPRDGGTRLTWRIRFETEPKVTARIMAPVLKSVLALGLFRLGRRLRVFRP